jgi:queuine tRNA-ribosyltransferase
MLTLTLQALEELPETLPRHGLGVGEPGDLLEAISYGVDTFDCVSPTRHGRHGVLYTKSGTINLMNEKYRTDFTTLGELSLARNTIIYDSVSPEQTATDTGQFTCAYLAHLLRSGEMLGQIIASLHNLAFLTQLVDGAREAIQAGTFVDYRAEFVREYYR